MSEIVEIHIPAEENGYPEINLAFRKPTLEEIGMVMSATSDPFKSGIKLLKTIFLKGDDWVFNDAILMAEISENLKDLINGYAVKIDETWNNVLKVKEFAITILVNKENIVNPVFKISRPNIEQLGNYTTYIETNPIVATRELYRACWLEGDISILENNDYVLSAAGALTSIMKRRTEAISKTWHSAK